MRQNHDAATSAARWVLIGFLLIAAFFLFTEHRAHLFGVLPFRFLLLCLLLHMFMHGSHAHEARPNDAGRLATARRNLGSLFRRYTRLLSTDSLPECGGAHALRNSTLDYAVADAELKNPGLGFFALLQKALTTASASNHRKGGA